MNDRERPQVLAPRDTIENIVVERYDRPTKVSQIASSLAIAIVEERLAPGAELNSVALARSYDTSRTPVREALLILESEGLVEMPPRRRPRVVKKGRDDLEENFRVRALLMGEVMLLLARAATDDVLDALEHLVIHMADAEAAGATEDFFWANVSFHDFAVRNCGTGLLKELVDSLFLKSLAYRRRSMMIPGRMELSLSDHRRLLQALRDRDDALAAALVRSIIGTSLQAVLETNFPAS